MPGNTEIERIEEESNIKASSPETPAITYHPDLASLPIEILEHIISGLTIFDALSLALTNKTIKGQVLLSRYRLPYVNESFLDSSSYKLTDFNFTFAEIVTAFNKLTAAEINEAFPELQASERLFQIGIINTGLINSIFLTLEQKSKTPLDEGFIYNHCIPMQANTNFMDNYDNCLYRFCFTTTDGLACRNRCDGQERDHNNNDLRRVATVERNLSCWTAGLGCTATFANVCCNWGSTNGLYVMSHHCTASHASLCGDFCKPDSGWSDHMLDGVECVSQQGCCNHTGIFGWFCCSLSAATCLIDSGLTYLDAYLTSRTNAISDKKKIIQQNLALYKTLLTTNAGHLFLFKRVMKERNIELADELLATPPNLR